MGKVVLELQRQIGQQSGNKACAKSLSLKHKIAAEGGHKSNKPKTHRYTSGHNVSTIF